MNDLSGTRLLGLAQRKISGLPHKPTECTTSRDVLQGPFCLRSYLEVSLLLLHRPVALKHKSY